MIRVVLYIMFTRAAGEVSMGNGLGRRSSASPGRRHHTPQSDKGSRRCHGRRRSEHGRRVAARRDSEAGEPAGGWNGSGVGRGRGGNAATSGRHGGGQGCGGNGRFLVAGSSDGAPRVSGGFRHGGDNGGGGGLGCAVAGGETVCGVGSGRRRPAGLCEGRAAQIDGRGDLRRQLRSRGPRGGALEEARAAACRTGSPGRRGGGGVADRTLERNEEVLLLTGGRRVSGRDIVAHGRPGRNRCIEQSLRQAKQAYVRQAQGEDIEYKKMC